MKIWLTILLFLSAHTFAGSLTASVDRNSLGADETLSLTLSSQGQSNDEPNISELKNDFDILGKSSSRSINIVNGNYQARTDWQIELAPKRTGKLLIPSFKLGKDVSDAIVIEVSATSSHAATDANSPIQLTAEIDKKTAYVQEQIFVKVKLTSQVSLSHLEPQPLQIPNARVVAYDTRQYQTSFQGRPQLVVETDYAIFPQEIGELVIPSLTYKIEQDTSRDFFSNPWGRSRNPIVKLSTDQHTIKVVAPEQNTPLSNWLPADSITLKESWTGSFDHLKVGDAITRSIHIDADGLTGAQIPPLTFENIDGLTFYPDQARIEDTKMATGVQGKRIESLAIVANRAGKFTLPAVELRWWNLKTKSFETVRLPEKEFEVVADPNATTKSLTLPSQTLANTANNSGASDSRPNSILIWQGFCALLLAMLVVLIYYTLRLKKQLNLSQSSTASHDYSHATAASQSAWQEIKNSAKKQNAVELRRALIHWAQEQWPDESIASLDQIANKVNHKELTNTLRALDMSLYGGEKSATVNFELIVKSLLDFQKNSANANKESNLSPLYPRF